MKSPFCTSAGVRTLGPLIKSQMLYQLSYRRKQIFEGFLLLYVCRGSNPGPSD